MDTLDNLLNRYFEGETSVEEETRLRALFASGEIPPQWEAYRPLFAYWDKARELSERIAEEPFDEGEGAEGIPSPDDLLKEMVRLDEIPGLSEEADNRRVVSRSDQLSVGNGFNPQIGDRKAKQNRLRIFRWVAGIAASVLLVLGTYRVLYPLDPCFCSDNYVVINGRCYTDIHKVRSFAWEALQEVATPADEYFPTSDEASSDREMIDDQLKELSSLFNE